MSKKIVDNWLALAKYDWDTAKHMLRTKRYLYVAFTCQQCIEKTLKAIYVKEKKTTPPYTHSLVKLAEEAKVKLNEEQLSFLRTLNNYYIASRYTEELTKMARRLTPKITNEIFQKTEKLYKWLLQIIR